jgi:RNA polymerase sigma factor (TIGR02999 family)
MMISLSCIIPLMGERHRPNPPSPRNGDSRTVDRLFASSYHELRERLRKLPAVRAHEIEQPTELLHEAYLRVRDARGPWKDRRHFIAYVLAAVRSLRIDGGRRKRARKRGGLLARTTLSGLAAHQPLSADELARLENGLERLHAIGPCGERAVRVLMLRYYWDLSWAEIATRLDIDEKTAMRARVFGRVWLNANVTDRAAVVDRGRS